MHALLYKLVYKEDRMRTFKPRVPEGGAIKDANSMRAEKYGEFMRSRLEGEYIRFAENALAWSAPAPGGSVLEIGPGPGWAGIMLLKRRPDLRLEGIDASPDMLRAASANAVKEGVGLNARYRIGTAESLEGVPDGSVDLVISRDSLHHWEDPGAAFRSILRVIKPSGSVYLADERRDLTLGAWVFVYAFGFLAMGAFSKFWRSSIRSAYTPEELRGMLPEVPGLAWRVDGGFIDVVIRFGPDARESLPRIPRFFGVSNEA
jgi:ubiquinone/menaquinone biosynthesis C-methylase UbiE